VTSVSRKVYGKDWSLEVSGQQWSYALVGASVTGFYCRKDWPLEVFSVRAFSDRMLSLVVVGDSVTGPSILNKFKEQI
jgi:hypothetical protein